MARPRKEIDYNLLDNLLGIFCTGEECASVLGVDYDTIVAAVKRDKKISFSDYSEQKKGKGRASLRRRQFQLAEKNVAMAIWLGKQYLDQVDESYLKGSGKNGEFKLIVEVVGEDNPAQESGNRVGKYFEV